MPRWSALIPSILLLLFSIALLPSCHKTGRVLPQITSPDTLSVHGGDTITIYGKNLPMGISAGTLLLNGKPLTFLSGNGESMQAIVPKMAGSGYLVLAVGRDTVNGPRVTYNYIASVTTIAGTGSIGSFNTAALSSSFWGPWGITADANGDLYIADEYNRLIRKYSAREGSISTVAGPFPAPFTYPYDIALDRVTHNLYVTDFNKDLVKVHPDGTSVLIYSDSMTTAGIAVGPDGYLYMSNNMYGIITRLDTNGNNRSQFGSGILFPRNLIFDKAGNLYVSAAGIFTITPQGLQTQYGTDPQFKGFEIARDTLGNIYEADNTDNCLRMMEASTGHTFTLAGSGNAVDADGIGLNASFDAPVGLCIDDNGALYMTTSNGHNSTGNKVRKITIQ